MSAGRPNSKRRSLMALNGDTRAAILRAAVREFGENGQAGARTLAIAKAAGVNIALVFYYFKNKKQMYNAALVEVFQQWSCMITPKLEEPRNAQAALLDYAGALFDFIAQDPTRVRLVQTEFLRGPSSEIGRVVGKHLAPVHEKLQGIIRTGVRRGELHPVEAEQLITSIAGMIVHYFHNSPLLAVLYNHDPMSPSALNSRRKAVLKMLERMAFIPGSADVKRKGVRQ